MKSFTYYLFIAFALIVLIAGWESNRTNAAVITPEIPKESIRLRILANSDSAQDQALKREIRDAIVARMQDWVTGPHTLEEARAVVKAHLPEFDLLVGDMIRERGYSYEHQVELGIVPFPTKMYGDEVYPAGNYEALRIIIGSGQGQNWWCVLFPPLCFVDSFTGEAVAVKASDVTNDTGKSDKIASNVKKKIMISSSASNKSTVEIGNGNSIQNQNQASDEASAQAEGKSLKPEVRFFLWDMIEGIIAWFK
jgi:stage II sporulation protein R